jgi:hypothetical protein
MRTMTAPTPTNGHVQKKQSAHVCEVFKTTNLGIFKLLSDNRDLNLAHVQRLIKSFEHKHLVSPIIVNEKYEVIDGQHRLEASKTAKVPIYYIVMPGYSIEDVQILNTNQKNWNSIDFLHMYCERGKKQYLLLKEFMEHFPDFKLRVCIRLLEGPRSANEQINGVNMHARRFEEGRFEIADLGKSYQVARKLTEFKPFFELYGTDQFAGAALFLFKKKGYNHKEMIHKLGSAPISLRKCSSVEEYLLLLEKIYNYKRQNENKISFRYSK